MIQGCCTEGLRCSLEKNEGEKASASMIAIDCMLYSGLQHVANLVASNQLAFPTSNTVHVI